ncbi:MAG: ester cyclase [Pseudomonadota bacterium]
MSASPADRIRAANDALLVRGDLESVGEFFDPNYEVHLTDEDLRGGHTLVRRAVGSLRESFTNLTVRVDVLLANGERVAWQRLLEGEHTVNYAGFPATGRPIAWRDMVVSRLRNDLIVEEWIVSDLAERLLRARKR